MKKPFYLVILGVFLTLPLSAQYQKIVRSYSYKLSASKNYYQIGLSYQAHKYRAISFLGTFHQKQEKLSHHRNFLLNIGYKIELFRLMNFYGNVSGRFFAGLTQLQVPFRRVNRRSWNSGLDGAVELEYYIFSRLAVLAEASQLFFIRSKRYRSLFLYGAGIKLRL